MKTLSLKLYCIFIISCNECKSSLSNEPPALCTCLALSQHRQAQAQCCTHWCVSSASHTHTRRESCHCTDSNRAWKPLISFTQQISNPSGTHQSVSSAANATFTLFVFCTLSQQGEWECWGGRGGTRGVLWWGWLKVVDDCRDGGREGREGFRIGGMKERQH